MGYFILIAQSIEPCGAAMHQSAYFCFHLEEFILVFQTPSRYALVVFNALSVINEGFLRFLYPVKCLHIEF